MTKDFGSPTRPRATRRDFMRGAAIALGASPFVEIEQAQPKPYTGSALQYFEEFPDARVPRVPDREALARLAGQEGAVAFVHEPARRGLFGWSGSDLSNDVAGDPLQGIYVPSVADPSGAAGAWVRISDHVTPEMFGWTTRSSGLETARIINSALRHARTLGIPYRDNGRRMIRGTISLGGTVTMEFGSDHRWEFDASSVETDYTEILERKRDQTERSGSGNYVAVDTSGAYSATIRGQMALTAARLRNSMRLAHRSAIPHNLVAFSAATENAAEIRIESLRIDGFGYGMFQGSNLGRGPAILGQTRMRIGLLYINFCLVPMESGNRGNGFNDMWVDILRVSRCGGVMRVKATDLNIGSMYNNGLVMERDAEAETITIAEGSRGATLSAANPLIAPGDVIAVEHGCFNKSGVNRIPFVSRVARITGTEILFDDAPEESLSGQKFLVNPPSTRIENGEINALHYYVEHIFDIPVELGAQSKFVSKDFKVSDGSAGCRRNTPILTTGMAASVDINLENRTLNDEIKAVVGFSKLGNGAERSSIVARIFANGDYQQQTVLSDAFTCVQVPLDRKGRLVDLSDAPIENINVVAHFGDGDYRFFAPADVTGPGSDAGGNAGTMVRKIS